MNDLNPLGLRASSFSLNGAHTKQKSTLLRKVWAFFVFPAFWVDFKNMNDLGPLGLRASSFSLIFGSYQTKVHFAAQS
jgi:hypothetical protein